MEKYCSYHTIHFWVKMKLYNDHTFLMSRSLNQAHYKDNNSSVIHQLMFIQKKSDYQMPLFTIFILY